MKWRRDKPIKIKDLGVSQVRSQAQARRHMAAMHEDGFAYFCAIPVKGKGVKVWAGRTERESPTRH